MAYSNNINSERISEEAHGDAFACLTDESVMLLELGFDSLFASDFSVAGTCDYEKLNESIMPSVEPYELDAYLGPKNHQNPSFDHDNNRALMNNLSMKTVVKQKQLQSNTRQIELSKSVGIGLPVKITKPSHQIAIVNQLEELFRPRYKSDYLSQNGKKRKPRYVADRNGNHFVTIKVPTGVFGAIRVDWLTVPTEFGDRYSMPYKFQQSNDSVDLPDCNPIYILINADSLGIMKIYLVLIKSKQDELKFLQPLKPFHPFQDVFGISDKSNTKQISSLNPKQLITMYQLDKSQLAFTYCALGSDGETWIPEWDTTVYSTVLTEMQPDNSKKIAVTCPNCTHVFQTTIGADDDDIQGRVTNKRKANRHGNQQAVKIPKSACITLD